MRAQESVQLATAQTGALADTGKPVQGGRYTILAHGTLGTGPAVEIQDPEGNWYPVTTSLTADTPQVVEMPSGRARAHLASGASGASVYAERVPTD